MALVLDCSVTLPWFLEDERSRFTDDLLDAIDRSEYWAPSLWRIEMLNGLLMAERRKRINQPWRVASVEQVARLNVRIDSALPRVSAIGELAGRHRLSAYDAAYLELAKRQDLPIATLDRDLAKAAVAEGVAVQSPGRSGVAQRRRRYNM